MTPNEQFLLNMRDAAKTAGHIWPEYAACEVALESTYGASDCFTQGNNLFNNRALASWRDSRLIPSGFGIVKLKTSEQTQGGQAIAQFGDFIRFPDVVSSFKWRMETLNRLPTNYRNALKATTGEQFVMQVSADWQKLEDVIDGSAQATAQGVYKFSDGYYKFLIPRWAAGQARAYDVMQIYMENASIFTTPESEPTPAPSAPEASAPTTQEAA